MRNRIFFNLLLTLIIASGAFLLIGGFNIIFPSHISWLINSDLTNNLVGWEFFRHEPWKWPLTRFDSLLYPFGGTTIQTDSIPWLSIVFKALNPILPDHFQYFGLWIFLNFILQAWFTIQIFKLFKFDRWIQIIIAAFFTISPVFIFRLFHIALSSQWLILACFWTYLALTIEKNFHWLCLFVFNLIAAGTHPYLFAMTFGFTLIIYFIAIKENITFKASLKRIFLQLSFSLLCIFTFTWIIGYFAVKEPGAEDFGSYSTDLLALFNSMNTSLFIHELRTRGGIYEGYAYLGLGLLILFIIALLKRKKTPKQERFFKLHPNLFWLWFGCLAFAFFSLSSSLHIGANEVITYQWLFSILGPLPDIFRASGRFIWPFYYFLLILIFWYALQGMTKKKSYLLLIFLLILQSVDLYPLFKERYFLLSNNRILDQKQWQFPAKIKIVHFAPMYLFFTEHNCAPKDAFNHNDYGEIAYALANQKLKLTSGMTSRMPKNSLETCEHQWERVISNLSDGQSGYVVHHNYIEKFLQIAGHSAQCKNADQHFICWKK